MQQNLLTIDMKVLFYPRKHKPNPTTGHCTLLCRISLNGQRCKPFSTKVSCKPEDFNSQTLRIKDDKIGTAKLLKIKYKIDVLYLDLDNKGVSVSAEGLKEYYLGKKSLDLPLIKLLDLYHAFRDQQNKLGEIADRTLARISVLINLVKEYLTYLKKINLSINEIDADFGESMYYWMMTDKKVKCAAAYSAKMVGSTLQKAIQFAIKKGYKKDKVNELRALGLSRGKEKEVEFLYPAELQKLENYIFPNDKLQKVADVFIFQCYTGLAYVDTTLFNPNKHIDNIDCKDEFGREYVKQYVIDPRKKTSTESVLPLFDGAKRIIDKYTDIDISGEKVLKLPILSNQKYNEYLKVVGMYLELPIELKTHTGRKTLGTWALNNGYTIEEVSAFLGHKDIKVTQKCYAKVLRREALRRAG